MDVYEKLKEMKLTLPQPPAKGGVYAQARRFQENVVYISGCGPVIDREVKGRLGKEFDVEQGAGFARNCMLNVLAVLEKETGDLNKVKGAVKVLVFVAGTEDFYEQPAVANGGTGLLTELFGKEAGAPARSAVGVYSLPGNIPVEIEAQFELYP